MHAHTHMHTHVHTSTPLLPTYHCTLQHHCQLLPWWQQTSPISSKLHQGWQMAPQGIHHHWVEKEGGMAVLLASPPPLPVPSRGTDTKLRQSKTSTSWYLQEADQGRVYTCTVWIACGLQPASRVNTGMLRGHNVPLVSILHSHSRSHRPASLPQAKIGRPAMRAEV